MTRSSRRRVFTAGVLVPASMTLSLTGCASKTTVAERIDEVLRTDLAAAQCTGAAVIVMEGDEVLYEAYLGRADVELDVPVTADSVFAIASMTKAFTAAAILLLDQDGVLSLSDSIGEHLPEVPESWQAITIRQLLDHSSGLPDDWSLHDDWLGDDHFFYITRTKQEFLKSLAQEPLLFTPGERWSYSCGPFIASMIIERVTGRSYADVMRTRVFDPLGMKDTRIDDPAEIIPNRVTGHLVEDGEVRHGMPISAAAQSRGDVGVLTTARDMVRWIRGIRDASLLGRPATQDMLSPVRLTGGSRTPAALGWFVVPVHGTRVIEHAGTFRTGFSSQIVWYPEESLVFILLTNSVNEASYFATSQRALGVLNARIAPIASRAITADPQPARMEAMLRGVQAAGTGEPSPLLDASYPTWYFGEDIRRRFASTTGLEFIQSERLDAHPIEIFEQDIVELIYCRAVAEPSFLTTLWLNREGRIVFIDWPEAPHQQSMEEPAAAAATQ